MPVQDHIDMAAAWLAHAPPPPPSTDPRKPRRSSSYDPLSVTKGTSNDPHTRGGHLPASSHSPEPERPRRTSISGVPDASNSTSTPPATVRRARSKVTSNPVPPAPSAFYNYQHQLQQHQQYHYQQPQPQPQPQPQQHYQQQSYIFSSSSPMQQHQPPYPSPVPMSHTRSESNPGQAFPDYHRERRGSAPAVPVPAPVPSPSSYEQQVLHHHNASQYYATPPSSVSYATAPAAVTTHAIYHADPTGVAAYGNMPQATYTNGYTQQPLPYQTTPQQPTHEAAYGQQPGSQTSQPWPTYAQAPTSQPQQPPFETIVYYSTPPPPQQQSAVFVGPPAQLSGNAAPTPQPFPSMGPPAVSAGAAPATGPVAAAPPFPSYVTNLSRQSTTSSVSSVGSVRRPLPQPNRTSSNPVAPGSPVVGPGGLASRASVRRDLPRPPIGSSSAATISAHTSGASRRSNGDSATNPGSPVSPAGGSATTRVPPSALNRTESVRMAAEALMARGVPQRRPLRSALASTTFSPPPQQHAQLPATPPTQLINLSSSQSEPVATHNGAYGQHYATVPPPGTQFVHSYSATPSILSAGQGVAAVPNYGQPQTISQVPAVPTVPVVAPVQVCSESSSPAPARYNGAVQCQAASQSPPQPPARTRPASYSTEHGVADVTASLAGVSVGSEPHARPASRAETGEAAKTASDRTKRQSQVPTFSFTTDDADEELEKPRRRRGSSVSRTPGSQRNMPQQQQSGQSAPTVPVINLSGDDDGGPVIQVSSAEPSPRSAGPVAPQISISADDDDVRSQTSTGSRGPAISVSFSGEPAAKSQRAGTSQSPAARPYLRSCSDLDRASSNSVGNGSGCHACGKWIAGKVVNALNTTFHPSCFVCAHCSEHLEHVAFYEHEGLPYCHFDYHELFSKRCFHCRTPIVDERFITVQDEELTGQDGETSERCYHELHFFCANCGDPFMDPKAAGSAAGSDPGLMTADENGKVRHGGMEFIVHKGYPYCEKCHISLHKPRCKGCRKPIIYDLINALGGKYHPECFTCAACSQPFTETQFFVKDGKPYDEECYKVLLRNMV